MPVRLPAALEGQPKIMVQPGGSVTFTIDLELMRAVMQDMGRGDIQLPDSLDGAVVRLDMPAGVAAVYGDCQMDQPPVIDPDKPATGRFPRLHLLLPDAQPVDRRAARPGRQPRWARSTCRCWA